MTLYYRVKNVPLPPKARIFTGKIGRLVSENEASDYTRLQFGEGADSIAAYLRHEIEIVTPLSPPPINAGDFVVGFFKDSGVEFEFDVDAVSNGVLTGRFTVPLQLNPDNQAVQLGLDKIETLQINPCSWVEKYAG